MRRLFMLAFFGLGLLLGMSGLASASDANGNHDTYTWVVGAVPAGSSDTAIAPDGSTITMKGSGTFTAGPDNSATGGGTYSLSSGGSGNWSVTGVQGFVSYGPAGFNPSFFGGEAKLDITLYNDASSVVSASGVLTIYCLLGSPPNGKEEGITVNLGNGGQFTKQDGGNTIFILA
jgi:hypothetical protein